MLLYAEGFDDFADDSDIGYRVVGSCQFGTGRRGRGKCVSGWNHSGSLTGNQPLFSIPIPPAGANPVRIVGFAFDCGNISWPDGGYFYPPTYDAIQFMCAGSSVLSIQTPSLGEFSIPSVGTFGNFYLMNSYIELKMIMNVAPPSAGLIVHLDGVEVYNGPYGWGTARTIDTIMFNYYRSVNVFWPRMDDLYVLDGTGTRNNDFLGDQRIISIPPISDGDLTQMAPSSGTTHYVLVNEVPPDEDVTYVAATASGQIDTYNFPQLGTTSNAGHLTAVQVMAYAESEAGGIVDIQGVVRKAGVNYFSGTDIPVPSQWRGLPAIFEVNPATGTPWLVSDIGVTQFGEKRTV